MKRGSYPVTLLGKILSVLMIFYIMLPLFFLMLFSFSAKIEVIPSELTFKWYLFNPDVMLGAIINTMRISIPSVAIAVTVSLLLSIAIVRMDFRGKNMIDQIIILPTIIPGTVLGLAFLQLANSDLFGRVPGLLILIFAHVVVTVPVISKPIIAALRQASVQPEEAAQTLGATPLHVFLTVTLPIIGPSVFVGMLLGFARSITDFVMTLYIVPPGMVPMSIQIYNSTQYSIQQLTGANASVLLLFTVVLVALAEKIIKKTGSM